MYQAIIFDFFGVIQADPYKKWLNKHGLKREGPYAEASDLADRGDITKDQFHARLSELSGEPIKEVETAFYDPLEADATLISFIGKLHKKYKIGLLSNSRGDYLRPILVRHGIEHLFDVDVISSEAGVIKPDPRIFKLTLEKLGVRPEQAVFIDDNSYNTEAASGIGISSILYRDLATLKEELAALSIDIA